MSKNKNDVTALRLAALEQAVYSTGADQDVDTVRENVLPIADLYLAYLNGESVNAPSTDDPAAAAAPERSGEEAVEAITSLVQSQVQQLGQHNVNRAMEGVRLLNSHRGYTGVIDQALNLLDEHSGDFGRNGSQALRTAVEGLR